MNVVVSSLARRRSFLTMLSDTLTTAETMQQKLLRYGPSSVAEYTKKLEKIDGELTSHEKAFWEMATNEEVEVEAEVEEEVKHENREEWAEGLADAMATQASEDEAENATAGENKAATETRSQVKTEPGASEVDADHATSPARSPKCGDLAVLTLGGNSSTLVRVVEYVSGGCLRTFPVAKMSDINCQGVFDVMAKDIADKIKLLTSDTASSTVADLSDKKNICKLFKAEGDLFQKYDYNFHYTLEQYTTRVTTNWRNAINDAFGLAPYNARGGQKRAAAPSEGALKEKKTKYSQMQPYNMSNTVSFKKVCR